MAKPYFFDGCLICNAVKDADQSGHSLTESELLKAFKAQEDKNKQQADSKKQKTGNFKGSGKVSTKI